ncbi:fibronectin type III domain-containing protein [Nonomuraea angiospora]|uniref:fibronectin type III domain-containing protein n=1 Tax=Nonomuraea angiospora TaxID=46172 RepID=UPI0033D0F1DC
MPAFAVLLLALFLAALWAAPADAQNFEPPNVVPSVNGTGSQPGSIIVRWEHSGSGVWDYSVERQSPYRRWDNVKPNQRDLWDTGLQPDTEYRYRVCAYFITEDGDVACSAWKAGRTSPPVPPTQQNHPPRPRIVGHQAGQTWIGIWWEAGHDYDSYFINIKDPFGTAKGPQELRTIRHKKGGTRGYRRVDGLLPGRVYELAVQGCTKTLFGIGSDSCHDWSLGYNVTTQAYPLHSGPDTCAPPFVWREAFVGDHVCVEESRRRQVAADNAQAQARRAYTCTPPNCLFVAPDTCKVPYVWREARPSDHVCVTARERSQVAAENALANQRRAVPR